MKIGHFENGIAQRAAIAALMRDEPTQRELATFHRCGARFVGGLGQRIYQDLVAGHGFAGGYDAVKRFVRQLAHRTELPFRRMECAPGHELQVDFGQGAWVMEDGWRRRPHLFRVVLSHSRKGYSEAV